MLQQSEPKVSFKATPKTIKIKLARSMYEFQSSLPSELALKPDQYYACFEQYPDNDDGWIEALHLSPRDGFEVNMDDSQWSKWLQCQNPQQLKPSGVIPKSYVEFIASADYTTETPVEHIPETAYIEETLTAEQLRTVLQERQQEFKQYYTTSQDASIADADENRSLHSDYSFRRSGVPAQKQVYASPLQFVAPKKSLLQRYTPFVTSGAEKYVMTGCLEIPQHMKYQYSTMSQIINQLGLSHNDQSAADHTDVQIAGVVDNVNKVAPSQDAQKQSSLDPIFISDGPQWLDEAQSFSTTKFTHPVLIHINQNDSKQVARFSSVKSLASFIKVPQIILPSGSYVTYEIIVNQRYIVDQNANGFQLTNNKLYSGLLDSGQTDQSRSFVIYRRYSHFVMLYDYLKLVYPMLFVPPLPPKSMSSSHFEQGHDESSRFLVRMRSLFRWLERILGHFVLRNDAAVEAFLLSDVMPSQSILTEQSLRMHEASTSANPVVSSDSDYDRSCYKCPTLVEAFKKLNKAIPDPAEFYLRVFHPEFNLQPDLQRDATYYNSLRRDVYPHPYNNRTNQTLSVVSGKPIEDDLTGDYATLKLQQQFLKDSEERLRHLRASFGSYRHLIANEQYREIMHVASTMDKLTDIGDEHVWCYIQNCSTCGKLSQTIKRLSYSLRTSAANDQKHIVVYDRLIEWMSEWSELYLHDGQIIDPIVSQHKSGVLIGKDIDRSLRQVQTSATIIEEPETEVQSQSINLVGQVHVQTQSVSNSSIRSPLFNPDAGSFSTDDHSIPTHLQPSHILARLSTVYNVNHAEINHWTHRQRQIEFFAIIEALCKAELERAEENVLLWRSCVHFVNEIGQQIKR